MAAGSTRAAWTASAGPERRARCGASSDGWGSRPTASPARARCARLGRTGRHRYGSRRLHAGSVGWDVAALQFLLERHGFPCGGVDGGFGARTVAAVARLQAHYGLPVVGFVGPATRGALRRAPAQSPLRLARPVAAAVGRPYGPRANSWHAGLDFPAATGTRSPRPAAGASCSPAGTTASG